MSSNGDLWAAHDIRTDILDEAVRPGAGEAVLICIRPEMHARMCRQTGRDEQSDASLGIPVVVDEDIPPFPGYEIHRAVPPQRSPIRSAAPPP